MAKKGNPNPKPPSSGGIPSNETLWLPGHDGRDIKKKGGLEKTVIWDVGDVIDFVFPKKFQPAYHKVACDFIKILFENDRVTKEEITNFLEKNRYSKSTLENKVIPKLVRFGLVKREREIKSGLGVGRGLILSESLTFTSYLERIAFGWNMLVSTARKKRGTQDSSF